jgi:hypothetical protein
MEKIYNTDWYYLRSSDWKVIPYGLFPDTDEGHQAALDAADAHAEQAGDAVLLYMSVDSLLDLQDELERVFKETHKDFINDDDE